MFLAAADAVMTGIIKHKQMSDSPSRTTLVRTPRQTRRPVISKSILCMSLFSALCVADAAVAADAADASGGLGEITITAEKYKSTVQDTPISISALSGDQLAAAGITSVEELAHDVPGLSMRSAGPGETEYEARGLASNGGAAPTVGFYLDEVPLSPPALSQSGKVVIDPDLYDVNRIEVLRGPQGTLYGSGSMGGTVKIVTNQPKLGTFEGSFQGTVSDTQGGGANGGGNIMFNLPIGDTLALRVVGSDSWRSGWIDRVVLNPFPIDIASKTRGDVLAAPVQSVATDVNTEHLRGGRASLLFQPSEDFSVLATAMTQRMDMGGYDNFDSPPGAAYMAHYEAFPIREPITDTISIYGLTLTANVGFADLTSATSYWNRREAQTQDASESIYWDNAQFTPPYPPFVAVAYSEIDPSHQFSQEVRLTSRGDDRLHWVVGGFYSDLHSVWIEQSADPANTLAPNGVYYDSINPYAVRQYAAFADGSYKITDTVKFSTGLRWYRYLSQQEENEWGFDGPNASPPAAPLTTRAADSGYNPRFNLEYSPNRDLTTYISASKGFRPGGANQIFPPPNEPPGCSPAPLTFGPDTVWDYEIGEKAKLFHDWLTINGDFYYIKWNGIQQAPLLACGYEYDTNAGDGRSFGPELEINAKLSEQWSATASGAYTDAKITEPNAAYINFLQTISPGGSTFCPSVSHCSAPILNVPKDTASFALIYSTQVLRDYQLTARVSDSFVGTSTDESYYFGINLPSYNIAAARVILSHDNWSANLFVDNLTNKVAETTANNTSFQFNIPALVRYSTNQPRTFGTQINYRF
jgi:iron complex outermembrane recepter protein